MASFPVDFAVTIGDFGEERVNENGQDYTETNAIANEFDGDWYSCVGNHDVNVGNSYDPAEVAEFYDQTPFEVNTQVRTLGYGRLSRPGNVEIIILNSQENFFGGGSPATGAHAIGQEQLDWLSAELDVITNPNARVVVLIHAPLKSETLRPPGNPADNLHDQTQAALITDLLIDWQAASDGGLVLGVIAGHTHVDDFSETTTANGTINHFTIDEFDEVPAGYPGSASVVSTDTRWMSYAHFSFNEANKILTVSGVGEQSSIVVDMADRV